MIILAFAINTATAGITFVRSSGITLTGADGITLTGADGITLTGADGILSYQANGITLTGADGITLTGADGVTSVGSDGVSYAGPNGITLTGADGITLTGADGITLTGVDGITLTGADGTQYRADSLIIRRPNGITLTGADGITLTGVDGITLTGADGIVRSGVNGITLTGADGITLTGADGITLTGADGITLTGADSITGIGPTGVTFQQIDPSGITLTGADGITLTGADGITLTGVDGIRLTNLNGITLTGADDAAGIQSIDPELLIALNNATDDSSINAVIVYHDAVTDADLDQLREIGILGGTRFKKLPIVFVSGTRSQIAAISHLPHVRSIYGNRTLTLNSDPYFNSTGVQRVSADADLRADNGGLPMTGRNVTVAVLDTGINGLHPDLAGKVVQNVRLADIQSVPAGFVYPMPTENLANTDVTEGHGTFVGGIIAGSGASSNGRLGGVAPGSRLVGLSAGDVNLMHVLSGFDYLLEKGASYNVRVVNCSFSANTIFDLNDPVNIATKMLTGAGVNVVFSAGNSGPGNGTMNPYAAAPWVVGVGATDETGRLASFSSRGDFGNELQHPSLVAPGSNVASLRSIVSATSAAGLTGADTQRLSPGELPYYTTGSGTSFSAPQVAGAIAMMLEANPNLRPDEVKDILSRTATPLPKYFYHEVGAGRLNTYAAVLEAAFPERHLGVFRSTLSRNSVKFITAAGQDLVSLVFPYAATNADVAIPSDTVQATVTSVWNLSANDFGLRVYNAANSLVGESNYVNLPGLTGRREKVVLRNPMSQTYRASVYNSLGTGTSQNVSTSLLLTRVEYPDLTDLSSLSPQLASQARLSMLMNLMMPEGRKFRPDWAVSRVELADAIMRAGGAPQYMASAPMFTDVRSGTDRGTVESVQSNPGGKLFFDANPGGRFNPNNSATKLIAAVALVKAAGLDSQAATASLPVTVLDALTVPAEYRGYAAIAIQKGLLSLDGNKFNPSRSLTRIELAQALNSLVNL